MQRLRPGREEERQQQVRSSGPFCGERTAETLWAIQVQTCLRAQFIRRFNRNMVQQQLEENTRDLLRKTRGPPTPQTQIAQTETLPQAYVAMYSYPG